MVRSASGATPKSPASWVRKRVNAIAVPAHTASCTRPTAPTPITLPSSSSKGRMLPMSTSLIRLDFSSTTDVITWTP